MDSLAPETWLVHICCTEFDGLSAFFCGAEQERVDAAVEIDNVHHFPDDMLCPICLALYQQHSAAKRPKQR
jgi:hypothetical protein